MHILRNITIFVVGCLLATGGVVALSLANAGGEPIEASGQRVARQVEAVGVFLVGVKAAEWVNAMDGVREVERHVDEYVESVSAGERAAARARAMQQHPSNSSRAGGASGASSGGGSCFGGPIPDYIVSRESGGNPTVTNSIGAYGCYQIIPSTWAAVCSDLGRDIAGQKACAQRLVDTSGLTPWATTR